MSEIQNLTPAPPQNGDEVPVEELDDDKLEEVAGGDNIGCINEMLCSSSG